MLATSERNGDGRKTSLDSRAVVEFLSRPEIYPDRPSHVQRVETHISWVFLTDRFAYKLKKTVRFDFLDFSTPERRRAACEQEVRINQRLAPDVYLGVVPLTTDRRERLCLGNGGTVVDWLVQMRRLPAEQALDRRIADGRITPEEVAELSDRLIDFYQHLPPLDTRTDVYIRSIETHVAANRRELLQSEHGLDAPLIKRVHTAQLRLLRLAPELLATRVCDGRIVEGHGDLRPEHIYFRPSPVVIDGIEFNDEFRRLDVLDELSFLAMECAYLGAEWIGNQVVRDYCHAADDHPPELLLRFYESYRACVRAKVAALRARQVTDAASRAALLASAARYLQLADRYVADSGPPLLIVVYGLSGTGKTVLADELAEQLGSDVLRTDALRRELWGDSSPAEQLVGFNEQRYSPENRERVYEEMLRRAERLLQAGVSVILDGTFLSAESRGRAFELALEHAAETLFVHCHCPPEVARQRVVDRAAAGGSLSEIRPEHLAEQQLAVEAESEIHELPTCEIDTTTSLPEMTQAVFARLPFVYSLTMRGCDRMGRRIRQSSG